MKRLFSSLAPKHFTSLSRSLIVGASFGVVLTMSMPSQEAQCAEMKQIQQKKAPIQSTSPLWLQELAQSTEFEYHCPRDYFDTNRHLLYGALGSDGGVEEFFYFIEKPTNQTAPNPFRYLERALSKVVHSSSSTQQTSPSQDEESIVLAPPDADGFKPEIRAVFKLGRKICGHEGIVHGGLTASLLDDVSGAAVFAAGSLGSFTANLNINYRAPVPASSYVMVRARVTKVEGRKTIVTASVEDGKGKIYAEATALFVKPKVFLPPSALVAAVQ